MSAPVPGSGSRRRARAREEMDAFARSTGLTSESPPDRYLWTDAFAVCNDLGLYVSSGEERLRDRALALVDQVHRVLGRHRPDDLRSGWISGLSEAEGARHPTAGGLRIGKPRPERRPDEPYEPRLEWERDGQYYHYLTRWMHALDRVWRVTGDETSHRWAVELAEAAHRGFVASGAGGRRLHWKASIDLSRPLVPSTGQHDPLDGFITLSALVASAPPDSEASAGALERPLGELREMCREGSWATVDPLGVGGLLVDALRCRRLRGSESFRNGELSRAVLDEALSSLDAVAEPESFEGASDRRLAFRELGLSLGIRALERLVAGRAGASEGSGRAPQALDRHGPLAATIEGFWLDPANRRAPGWAAHREISRVMLATCLAPEGYLGA